MSGFGPCAHDKIDADSAPGAVFEGICPRCSERLKIADVLGTGTWGICDCCRCGWRAETTDGGGTRVTVALL